MSTQLPIKGQEVTFTVSGPDGTEESVSHVKDASFTFDLEILTEQYLGQVADQFDEIFHGVTVELTFDVADPALYDLVRKVVDRAQRRIPATTKFSVVAALKFPNGQRRRMMFPDLAVGEIPTSFGGRAEYGESKFTFKGSSFRAM